MSSPGLLGPNEVRREVLGQQRPNDAPAGDSLCVGEIRRGIVLLSRRDQTQAGVYEAWLVRVLRDCADRVLPVDAEAAEEWERMNVQDPISIVDGLMAATAKVRNMTFVTRNTADVTRTGARLLNSFDASE
jgi:toxin FitB